jgi:hypothetical protein
MRGQCLCGSVHFECADSREIGVCHCGMCRRWSGGPMLAVHCGPNVGFWGTEHIGVHKSSDWAERAFCKECGTHLYYKFLANGEYFIPAGAFDSQDFKFASQIYVDSKPAYYDFANKTPMLTEKQVIEKFMAPDNAAGQK